MKKKVVNYIGLSLLLFLYTFNLKSQSILPIPNLGVKVSYIYNASGFNFDKVSDIISGEQKSSGFAIGIFSDVSVGMTYLRGDLEYKAVGFDIFTKPQGVSKSTIQKIDRDNLSLGLSGGISILDIIKFYVGLTCDFNLNTDQKKESYEIKYDMLDFGFKLGVGFDLGFAMVDVDYRDVFSQDNGVINILTGNKKGNYQFNQSMSTLFLSLSFIIL